MGEAIACSAQAVYKMYFALRCASRNPGERFSIILALPMRSAPPASSQMQLNISQTQRPTTKLISQRAVVTSDLNELLEASAPWPFRCQLRDQSLNFIYGTYCGRRSGHWDRSSSLERRRVDDRMEHRSKIVQLSAPRSGRVISIGRSSISPCTKTSSKVPTWQHFLFILGFRKDLIGVRFLDFRRVGRPISFVRSQVTLSFFS